MDLFFCFNNQPGFQSQWARAGKVNRAQHIRANYDIYARRKGTKWLAYLYSHQYCLILADLTISAKDSPILSGVLRVADILHPQIEGKF